MATAWCAMLPPAPALFSTTTVWPEVLGELLGDDARGRVRGAARGEADQHGDGARREVGLRGGGAGEGQGGGGEQQAFHGGLLGACCGRRKQCIRLYTITCGMSISRHSTVSAKPKSRPARPAARKAKPGAAARLDGRPAYDALFGAIESGTPEARGAPARDRALGVGGREPHAHPRGARAAGRRGPHRPRSVARHDRRGARPRPGGRALRDARGPGRHGRRARRAARLGRRDRRAARAGRARPRDGERPRAPRPPQPPLPRGDVPLRAQPLPHARGALAAPVDGAAGPDHARRARAGRRRRAPSTRPSWRPSRATTPRRPPPRPAPTSAPPTGRGWASCWRPEWRPIPRAPGTCWCSAAATPRCARRSPPARPAPRVLVLEAAPVALRGGNSRHTRNMRTMHDGPARRADRRLPRGGILAGPPQGDRRAHRRAPRAHDHPPAPSRTCRG